MFTPCTFAWVWQLDEYGHFPILANSWALHDIEKFYDMGSESLRPISKYTWVVDFSLMTKCVPKNWKWKIIFRNKRLFSSLSTNIACAREHNPLFLWFRVSPFALTLWPAKERGLLPQLDQSCCDWWAHLLRTGTSGLIKENYMTTRWQWRAQASFGCHFEELTSSKENHHHFHHIPSPCVYFSLSREVQEGHQLRSGGPRREEKSWDCHLESRRVDDVGNSPIANKHTCTAQCQQTCIRGPPIHITPAVFREGKEMLVM